MKNGQNCGNRLWLKYLTCFLLLLLLVFSGCIGSAEEEKIKFEFEPLHPSITVDSDMTQEELAQGYINKMLYPARKGIKKAPRLTGDSLDEVEKRLYQAVVLEIKEVAAGRRSSTSFEVPVEEVFDKISFTAADLLVSAITEIDESTQEIQLTQEAVDKMYEKLYSIDFNAVIQAWLLDYPYELYWYDKTCSGPIYIPYVTGNRDEISFVGSFVFNLTVASEYTDGSSYNFNVQYGLGVQDSVNNAAAIVSTYANLSDLDKLYAYRDAICDLVEYNYDALEEGTPYGNPWQLIWVFDGNESTNVVCEGYAKAFQYLCNITNTFSESITAISVSGIGDGGAHMWNFVTMEDGMNYLVDCTWSDSGSGNHSDTFFLIGYSEKISDLEYKVNNGNDTYELDADMFNLFSASELALADHDYGRMSNTEYSYQLKNGGVTITNYYGEGGDVVIPAMLDGIQVTAIEGAFKYNSAVTSITVPEGVWLISQEAFAYCDQLLSVSLPSSVTNLGDLTFFLDSSLSAVNVDEANQDYASVDGVLFSKDMSMLLAYPCSKAGSAYAVPDGVSYIANSAFCYAQTLESVTVPASVTAIGEKAFQYCFNLSNIQVGQGNTAYASQNGILFDSSLSYLIVYPIGRNDSYYAIPEGTAGIFNNAFENCYMLETISIPEGVVWIGNEAFSNSGLTSVTLPGSITELGEAIFSGCQNLASVTLPNHLASIGAYAFSYCASLAEIQIPSSVQSIDDQAFSGCTQLIIYGYANTEAESFALRSEIEFVPLSYVNAESIQYTGNENPILFVPVGETVYLNPYVLPENATNQIVSYEDRHDGVIDMNNDGSFLAVGPGRSVVTFFAEDGSIQQDIEVAVYSDGGDDPSRTDFVDAYMSDEGRLCMDIVYEGSGNPNIYHLLSEKLYFADAYTTLQGYLIELSEYTNEYNIIFQRITLYPSDETCSFVSGETLLHVEMLPFDLDECFGTSQEYSFDSFLYLDYPSVTGQKTSTYVNYNQYEITAVYPDRPTVMTNPDMVLPASMTVIGDEAFSGIAASRIKLGEKVTSIGNLAFADCPNLKEIYIPATTTTISSNAFNNVENLVIYGYEESKAEQYANEKNIRFVPVE